MVNVLPPQTKRSLTRRYYAHLLTVVCTLGAVVLALGGALLIPSFLLSTTQAESYERYRDALSGSIGLKEREKTEIEVQGVAERIRILGEYAGDERVVDALEGVLQGQPESVRVTGISLARAEGGFSVSLSGVANTRTDLLEFVDVLRTKTNLQDVALPVAQLVAERDVPFSLSMVVISSE